MHGNLHTPQLAAGSESERMYLLLLRWIVQKSAMKMWAVATLEMVNMDMLANILQILGLLSGRSGGSWTSSSPSSACRWPPCVFGCSWTWSSPSPVAGNHHGNSEVVGLDLYHPLHPGDHHGDLIKLAEAKIDSGDWSARRVCPPSSPTLPAPGCLTQDPQGYHIRFKLIHIGKTSPPCRYDEHLDPDCHLQDMVNHAAVPQAKANQG